MNTLECGMQLLETGAHCEEVGCSGKAKWYVTRADDSFHWCAKHAVTTMEERDFWRKQAMVLRHISP